MPGRLVPQLHEPHGDPGPGGRRSQRDPHDRAVPQRLLDDRRARRLPRPAAREIDYVTAGVNHLAWVLRLEQDGGDLYPRLRAAVDAGRVPDDDLVRAELFRRFGFYPTESSEHHAEYNPWFIPKDDLVARFHIPIGEYLDRVANNLEEFADTKRRLDAGEPFEIERSGEYAAVIAHARATGEAARIVGNVIERPGPDPEPLRRRVRRGAVRRRRGGRPSRSPGPLPAHCAAYVHPAVDTQTLTVQAALEEDREAIYHAVLCDPQVQARLTLDEAWHMTDELIAAEAAGSRRGWAARGLTARCQEEEETLMANAIDSRAGARRSLAIAATVLALVPARAARRRRARARRPASDAPASVAPAVGRPGGSPRLAGYTGPAASIEYSIWGDPAEIESQTKLVESFEAANPTITSRSPSRTGTPTGTSS